MNDKNYAKQNAWVSGSDTGVCGEYGTHLEERILLLMLELVRTEEAQTALCLRVVETVLGRLEESEDVLDDDGLEVDLLLVIEIFGLELDLMEVKIDLSVRDSGLF